MQLGINIGARPLATSLGPDLRAFVEAIKGAEAYGFTRVSTADTQPHTLECFSALTLMATLTRTCALSPSVTNPVTRDAGVMANAIASVDAISGGRALLLIGRGDSAVHDVGQRSASVEQLKEYVLAVRSILTTGSGVYQGRTIRGAGPKFWAGATPRKIPIHIAAEGPRMLRLAGEIGDGVMIGAGLLPEIVQDSLALIRQGARDAERDPAEIDIWWHCRFSIAPTTEEALARGVEAVSSAANHALRSEAALATVPPELQDGVRAYHAQYDYGQKGRPQGGTNSGLMQHFGIAEYAVKRFGVVGSPEVIVERLHELRSLGIDKLVTRGTVHYALGLKLMGERVMPHVLT